MADGQYIEYTVAALDPSQAAAVAALDQRWFASGSAPWRELPMDAAAVREVAARPDVAFLRRADNSRGPGGPVGPLCTPLMTPTAPGTLSKSSITH